MKIIGIQHSVGEFTPKDSNQIVKFDNYNLYCADANSNPNWYGYVIRVIKVKAKNMGPILQTKKLKEVRELLNLEFDEELKNRFDDVIELR